MALAQTAQQLGAWRLHQGRHLAVSDPPGLRAGETIAPMLELRHGIRVVLEDRRSEGDIRDCVKWRKISGGTRSDLGKHCRDACASLQKTCRKLGISFWEYLGDRIGGHGSIALLPDVIRERAAATSTVP